MRIIAGEFKGRNLAEVPDKGVRPATDRVRSTIFNMLQNRLSLFNAHVLDVFAGTGSLGFEAVSRGAGKVVFVEFGNPAIKTLEENIELLRCEDRCEIVHSDAEQYINHCNEQYDLIFVDPPYAYGLTAQYPEMIFSRNLLKNDGILIIEHSNRLQIDSGALYKLSVRKEFGQTHVSFFVHSVEK